MIGKQAEAVLNRAVKQALDARHEYFTLEHVLWSLLEEPRLRELITACGGVPETLQAELLEHLKREVPQAPKATEGESDREYEHPVATLSIQRMVQRALVQVQSSGRGEIRPEDLLVAIFQAKESHALFLLQKQGIERLDVLNYVSHGISKGEEGEDAETEGEGEAENESREGGGKPLEDPLKTYASNLNERARLGRIDPLVGRSQELDRILQILCRRRKNNPLLVGEAGVGKTALAEGLALRIVEGQVPELLKNAVVYALDLGGLLAGAKFRGDFEQRLKRVLKSLEKKKETGKQPILFIDEIHTIMGAGAVNGGAMDAANLLKPLLAQGDIRCMGSTTYAEYRSTLEKDHALSRRFQKLDVLEPSQEEAIKILEGLKARFEEHHGVTYAPEALRSAVELSAKHLTDRQLPDKAIDLIDEAGARARLSGGTQIGQAEIEALVAQVARIPARSVSVDQKTKLKNLDRDLKLSIFGQDAAVEALVTAIRLSRSGLRSGDKPVGSFLFCGPTGVGKTELTKQLGQCLGIPLLRYDMSEYGEKHTVSRLIGAPPGYVGFDQAGLLTEAVLKNPHSVVLLDEIEKAHPDIWNVLLQVMDHGTLTDNNGRKADFRNVILVMTSNVGSRELERRPLGVALGDGGGGSPTQAVEQTFSPEFRNRLDAVVYFKPLDPETVKQVVSKHLLELEAQLLAKGVEVAFDNELRDWLAREGYDRRLGARPLARLIQDRIKKPLAEEILFGKLEKGGEVRITLREGTPQMEVTASPVAATRGHPEKQTEPASEPGA